MNKFSKIGVIASGLLFSGSIANNALAVEANNLGSAYKLRTELVEAGSNYTKVNTNLFDEEEKKPEEQKPEEKKGEEHKCGEGKCGEGEKKGEEHKCGEGKCGEGEKKSKEEKKGEEGKCGENTCGGGL